jgi:hypothetical protein
VSSEEIELFKAAYSMLRDYDEDEHEEEELEEDEI